MTKYFNPKQPTHSNKDFPGCMGGLLNLFDFNQAHNGRRLLTEKRHGNGLEAPRNSLDVSLETPPSSEVKNEDIPYAYEMSKVPTTRKKASGMPMKTLIAQEMSKEKGSKRRTPSVIARLMGLDAMPVESVSVQHIKAAEIHPQKNNSGNQKQWPKSPHDAQFFQKHLKVPASRPVKEYSLPKPYEQPIDHTDQRNFYGSLPFRDHPQEKQLQEFKKQFAAWQASKIQDHSKSVQPDELKMQLAEKQMLVCEKLNEEKMALVHESVINSQHLATDEELQSSKEFLNALEVLQSNKELFLKFLQEPNSLLEKHPQDIRSTSEIREKQLPKMKSSNPMKIHGALKEKDNSQKHSKGEKKNEKRLKRQKGKKFLIESEVEQVRVLPPEKSMQNCSVWGQKNNCPALSSDGKNNICSLPTRIVVLKPAPGRCQNFRPSPSPSCSPRSQTGFRDPEGARDSTQDFLQEVSNRLKMGFAEKRKDESRINEEFVSDQIRDAPKHPRQISRQIARQVKESVTKDMANNSLNRLTHTSPDVRIITSLESSTSGTKSSWDYRTRLGSSLSSPAGKPSDSPEYGNKAVGKTISERSRATQGHEEKQHIRQIEDTSGKLLAFPDENKQVSRSKSYQQNNRANMGDEECYEFFCDMHEPGSKIKRPSRRDMHAEWNGSLDNKNVDINRDISPSSLLRSQSFPVSATSFERGSVGKNSNALCVNRATENEIDRDRRVDTLPVESIKYRSKRSRFKAKVSNLKGRFLLRKRRSSSKKIDSLYTLQSNNHLETHLDKGCDLLPKVPFESGMLKKRLDNLDNLPVVSLQKTCPQTGDVPDMATEQLQSTCNIHRVSTVGEKGSAECVLEAAILVPATVKNETLSGIGVDCMTDEISPGELLGVPSCCATDEVPVNKLNESCDSEKTKEEGGCPNPVSDLDFPVKEETPRHRGFKEISSNLQELRLCLDLLKFHGSGKPSHASKGVLLRERLELEDLDTEKTNIDDEKQCNLQSETKGSPLLRFPVSVNNNVDIESVLLNDISCPKERHDDLLYLTKVLVASGFIGNADMIFAQWYSSTHPLDPSIYEKIEECYSDDMQFQTKELDTELSHLGSIHGSEVHGRKSEKRLLFCCINEVLLEILGPFINARPWVRQSKKNLCHMPVGKQLLEETWRKISYYLYPQSEFQCTFENLVAKDLNRESAWLEMQDDIETGGIEVDSLIFNELIEEVVCDMVC